MRGIPVKSNFYLKGIIALVIILAFAVSGEGKSSMGTRLGVFDSLDPRIKEYYGYGAIISLFYEWSHPSGLGVKPFASYSYSEKKFHGSMQSFSRFPVGIVGIYRPLYERYSISPYLGFGYVWIFTHERAENEFMRFAEGGYPSNSFGYAAEFGLDYRLSERFSLSWESQLTICRVTTFYSLGGLDYGGIATTVGLVYHF